MPGNKLTKIREGKGMTVEQLARRADLAGDSVRNIEKGVANPTIGTLRKIAAVLECDVKDLID